MKREIKFRAWDVKRKRMFEPRILEYTPGGGMWPPGEENIYDEQGKFVRKDAHPVMNASNPESAILLQFTGFTDKKGREIYDGDIVGFIESRGVVFMSSKGCWSVKWTTHSGRSTLFELVPPYRMKMVHEVLGNIYENPDLLKSV
ncbi:MAG TPA: YopX family protein [Acidimicrobiales bacterium]|jgi:uncharacterized phage protein (TIGR01671 family)|nr:YopX family protein [Acidimicrobiales bacterium]